MDLISSNKIVEVAGTWELGWSAPITEAVMWEMVMREFGVTQLHMTPVTGISKRWIKEYSTFKDLLDSTDLIPVFLDENGATELAEFEHPNNALYVFGKGTYSPFSSLAKEHISVRIDSVKPGMLWPHQALAIVLYDRSQK